jgi:hypothetical protein
MEKRQRKLKRRKDHIKGVRSDKDNQSRDNISQTETSYHYQSEKVT